MPAKKSVVKCEQDLHRKCVETAVKSAQAVMGTGVEKWIELSSARAYRPNKETPVAEDGPLEPVTSVARFRLEAEEQLRGIEFV